MNIVHTSNTHQGIALMVSEFLAAREAAEAARPRAYANTPTGKARVSTYACRPITVTYVTARRIEVTTRYA